MESRFIHARHGGAAKAPFAFAIAAAGAAALLATAYAIGSRTEGDSTTTQLALLVTALPAVAASALFATRKPAWSVVSVFALIASAGTLAINQGVNVRPLVWLLLVGVLTSMVVGYVSATRSRAISIWPGIAALAAYLTLTMLAIPFAETTSIGVRAFAAGPAFALAFFALAYSPWTSEIRWMIAKGFVAVALAVGAYALFRLLVGPTGAEEAVARRSAGVGGDLSLFGSFSSRLELGAWSAVVIPFLFAFALAARGRWRWLGITSLGLMLIALLGSEVRTALIGAALGIALATALFQSARAFRGQLGTAALATTALGVAGIAGFALTVGTSSTSTERFERIVNPGEDYSFQRRVEKWDVALAEINEQPFGQGLGTAGITQRQFSRFYRLDNKHIDNSYLQLGIQQGYPGWILFGGSLLLILYLLARSSVATGDTRQAILGIGAIASLISWLVCLMTGDMLTSWGALLLWMILGLGVSGFVAPDSRRART